jgi:hypothetical protein
MAQTGRIKHVYLELKEHMPFTMVGALLGIAFMLLSRNISQSGSHTLFLIFHPTHVVLSAIVTASLFKLHSRKTKFWIVLLVGYFSSVGIATLSDSIIPYLGEKFFMVNIPSHADLHADPALSAASDTQHTSPNYLHHLPHKKIEIHLGFLEDWYLVNPAAFLGILIAWFLPRTKFPHAGHILISTWASAAHILMNAQSPITPLLAASMFLVLFFSVWLPCCFSDIVFPILIVDPNIDSFHSHSHPDRPKT